MKHRPVGTIRPPPKRPVERAVHWTTQENESCQTRDWDRSSWCKPHRWWKTRSHRRSSISNMGSDAQPRAGVSANSFTWDLHLLRSPRWKVTPRLDVPRQHTVDQVAVLALHWSPSSWPGLVEMGGRSKRSHLWHSLCVPNNVRHEDDHGDDVETGPRGIIQYHAHVQVDVPDKDHGKHPIIGTKESQGGQPTWRPINERWWRNQVIPLSVGWKWWVVVNVILNRVGINSGPCLNKTRNHEPRVICEVKISFAIFRHQHSFLVLSVHVDHPRSKKRGRDILRCFTSHPCDSGLYRKACELLRVFHSQVLLSSHQRK